MIIVICILSPFGIYSQNICGTDDLENPLPNVSEDYSNLSFNIRLYFVLIRKDDGSGEIQESIIDSVMAQLESIYDSTGISFTRMCHFYIDSTSWYNNGCILAARYNKNLDKFITDDGVTIFIQKNECGNVGGQTGTPQGNRIWVRNDHGLNQVASHEMGHVFNLFHTEHSSFGIDCGQDSTNFCQIRGDLVCDTPPDFPSVNSEFNCTWNSAHCRQVHHCYDSCNNELMPMVDNLMTNKYLSCRSVITPKQCDRMKRSIMENKNGYFDIALVDQEIDHDTTFSVPTFSSGNLTIKSGVTLTVTSVLSIPRTKKIIVEPGAVLKLEGGLLTSNNIKNICNGTSIGDPNFWYGIELQTGINMAPVSCIINNGKVEYSEFGIHLKDNAEAGNYIIRIDSSTFKNNKHSIYLRRKPTGGSYPITVDYSRFYISSIDNTQERKFPLSKYFSQIYVDNAVLNINKCTFDNPSNFQAYDDQSYAVRIFNTSLQMNGDSVQNTIFKDVDFGVLASGMLSSKTFSSTWCRYENNLVGIRVGAGVNNYIVKHNTFFKCKNIGLWSDQSSGYKISQNLFNNGTNNSSNYIGILMENSGNTNNLIDNNKFEFIQGKGSQTVGKNGLDEIGLQYRCNSHVGNGFDYFLEGSVNANQGEPGNAAGNSSSGGIKFNTINLTHNITYYHRNLTDETPLANSKVFNVVSSSKICSFGSGGGGPGVIFPQWKVKDDSLTSKKNQLVSLIDQNQTNDLINLIQNADSVNVVTVYNFLMGISPWLSREVVLETYVRTGFFSNNQKYQLLLENPDNYKIPDFSASLRNQEYSIPDSLLNALDSLVLYSTARTLLEASVSQAAADAAVLCFEAISHYKNPDSLDTDSLTVWLERAGDYRSLKELVDLSIENSDFSDALETLELLPTSVEGEEDVSMCESLIGMIENVYDDNRYEGQLDSAEQAVFLELAGSGNTITSREAKAVLDFYYFSENESEELIYAGNGGATMFYEGEVNIIQSLIKELTVKIYPNPSNGNFSIEIGDVENRKDLYPVTTELLDVTGRKIWKRNFYEPLINVENQELENGFYILRLNSDQYGLQIVKVFIQR